ncbi:MAG: amidohydrolase family protein [Rhizomicrobium sp.]
MKRLGVASVLLICLAGAARAATPLPLSVVPGPANDPAQTEYVQAGSLLANPADGQVLHNKTLVVRNGQIVEIRDGFVGEGHVIDLRNKFVLPGLIDSHVHICAENGPDDKMNRVTKTSADLALDGAHFAWLTLEAGFTTVQDLGEDNNAIFSLRDAIARGMVPGPRIIAAGNVLSAPGGDGDVYGYRPDVMAAIRRPNICSGAEDCRRLVREQVQRGADVIKFMATGSVLSDIPVGVDQQFTEEEMKAIVETAHALGRRVAAHAHGTAGINAALRAGVDSIEHGTFLNDESIKLFKEHGTYLVPTLLAGDTVTKWANDPNTFLSPVARQKALLVGPEMLAMGHRAHEAHLKVAFGTDSSVSPHGENAREFALMVKAGFSPLEAIQAATTNGADHLQLSKEVGSLAPGKQADIVAVAGDPLNDVTILQHVVFVMKGGVIFKQ